MSQNIRKYSLSSKLAIFTSLLFTTLLLLLHLLEPGFSPSWRLISEYELGKYGWIMRLAFFSLALSGFSLLFAIRRDAKRLSGKLGMALLGVASLGLVVAGSFQTDAVTVPREAWTTHGALHAWGALMVIRPHR